MRIIVDFKGCRFKGFSNLIQLDTVVILSPRFADYLDAHRIFHWCLGGHCGKRSPCQSKNRSAKHKGNFAFLTSFPVASKKVISQMRFFSLLLVRYQDDLGWM